MYTHLQSSKCEANTTGPVAMEPSLIVEREPAASRRAQKRYRYKQTSKAVKWMQALVQHRCIPTQVSTTGSERDPPCTPWPRVLPVSIQRSGSYPNCSRAGAP